MSETRDSINKLLGESHMILYDLALRVIVDLSRSPVSYKFMNLDEFECLFRSSRERSNQILFRELLMRAHIATATSLTKAVRWMQGAALAYDQLQFLPFCSSVRGLLESVADASVALSNVPNGLAEYHVMVKRALSGELSDLVDISIVEQPLVHYTEARRLNKDEKRILPKEMKAEESRSYIESYLERFPPGGYLEFYYRLCEYVHPASSGVTYMLQLKEDGRLQLMVDSDSLLLESMLGSDGVRIRSMFQLQANISLITLKCLMEFDMPELHSPSLSSVDFSSIKLWGDCEAFFAK